MPSSEILAVLVDEVAEVDQVIRAASNELDTADEAAFGEAAAGYAEQVQRIAAVCDALALDGLKQVCAFIDDNLAALASGNIGPERRVLFERWPVLVLGYLKAPRDGVYSRELAEYFQRGDWPKPLDASTAQQLELTLANLGTADETDTKPARASIARPEDVVLEIPSDVNPRLTDAFLSEGPQQASEYSALIQRVVRGDGWSEELNECRRLIHGLKGAANTVGVRGVAMLCHHVEDIFEYLVDNAAHLDSELARLLTKVADTLEIMFESLLGTTEAPADAQAVLQSVLDWVNRIEQGDSLDSTNTMLDAQPTAPATDSGLSEVPFAAAVSTRRSVPSSVEKVEPKVRVAVRVIDEMLRTSGEVTISSGHVLARLRQTFAVLAELRERHNALWERSNDMDAFVATQGIAAGKRQALAVGGTTISGFDPLEMDQYGELHTYVHGLTETVADLQLLGSRLVETLTAVDAVVNQHAALNGDLHDLLMTSRMAPAGNLDSRLQRTVRQAAEQCAKQVTLVLQGHEVLLDDQMVNVLIDPLQHLLRNAVDHGLEPAPTRAALGKPEIGRIVLTFARDGNYLLITCADDGAGLDLPRIYARAIERGLVAADQSLSDDEIVRLILCPGFSTSETVTEISGRGVGMDIVHTNVAKLKGSISIHNGPGRGATFTLRLPLSLGIAHCLIATVHQQTYALPTDNLERIVHGGARHVVQQSDGRYFYSDGEVNCPARSLSELLGYIESTNDDGTVRHVILMNDVVGKVALVVDSVIGGQDLVIKNMGRYLTGIRGVIGASILGDGGVVPILNVAELLRLNLAPTLQVLRIGDAIQRADILVVDDSLSVRTALATLLSDEGFRVRTAKDGVEAIEAIDERLPAVVLADLEMPRMNGLELTAHIRNNVGTRDLPVIMVTSRTAEKHRHQAQVAGVSDYVTKPYRESDLVSRVRTIIARAA